MTVVFSHQISTYSSLYYEQELLISKSELIRVFFQRNLPFDFKELLAIPIVKANKVEWNTIEKINWQELDQLSILEKEFALKLYHSYLFEVEKLVFDYERSENREFREWGQLIKLVVTKESNKIFYCDNKILIVWGFVYGWDERNSLFSEQLSNFVRPGHEFLTELQNSSQTEIISSNSAQLTEKEDDTQPINPIISEVSSSKPPRAIKPKREGLFYDFLNWTAGVLRRFWWLILILIVIFLYWWISSGRCGCHNEKVEKTDERTERLREILPDEGKVLPIDTTKIIKDSLGKKIIGNVVNIAPKDKKIKIEDFAIKLKEKYPGKEYEIVYYNKEANYLQLEFPEKDKSTIKNDIKSKFPETPLLIWDERIFETKKFSSDPVYNNVDDSWYLKNLGMDKVWEKTKGDTSVIICVIDDGFDLTHKDYPKRIFKPYNVLDKSSNVNASAERNHGTHVAGTIFAVHDNNFGTAGIAPNCTFMPVQIAQDGTTALSSSYIIEGVLYAIKNGADVINMSIANMYDPAMIKSINPEDYMKTHEKDEEYFWKDLFDYANKENVTIVMAGGNQNIPIGLGAIQRDNSVIRVSSYDKTNKKSNFSNFGKYSDVSAPGSSIYNCVYGSKFEMMDGTSMASPIVAGVIGLMKSRNKSLTNAAIKNLIQKESTKKFSNIGPMLTPTKLIK